MHTILETIHVHEDFDKVLVQEILDALCRTDNINIYLHSQSFTDEELTETEEWFSTRHTISKFSDELIAKMMNPKCEIKSKKLGLPPPNNLIPKNFDILPKNEKYSRKPTLLKQWDDTDLWYQKDD